MVEGKPIEGFVLDLTHARIADYQSRVGPRGSGLKLAVAVLPVEMPWRLPPAAYKNGLVDREAG